jgi:hypothetical protein
MSTTPSIKPIPKPGSVQENAEHAAHLALISLGIKPIFSSEIAQEGELSGPSQKRKLSTRSSSRNVKVKVDKIAGASSSSIRRSQNANNSLKSNLILRPIVVSKINTSNVGDASDDTCDYPTCLKSAKGYTKGMCRTHGGHTCCKHPVGCGRKAQLKGLCTAHGGGRKCTYGNGCPKLSKGKGGRCFEHGGGKPCSKDGCAMRARVNTFCGAHAPKCTHASICTNRVVAKGLCSMHGGGTKCKYAGGNCKTPAHKFGLCSAHGDGMETKCKHPSGCIKYRQVKRLCKAHARLDREAEQSKIVKRENNLLM